jgi:hypothetical protein
MGETAPQLAQSRVRARRIEDADVPRVVDLLTRGFGARRPRQFWEHILGQLASRAAPANLPRYGCVLERDGTLVGAILQIFATMHVKDACTTRCNVSSWYVEPQARMYAPLLVSQALRHDNVTYLNISAAPHTRAIAEAHGYTCYSNGVFLAIPALSRAPAGRAILVESHDLPDVPFDPHERDLLLEHAEFGCISLWCVTPERAYPFVFRSRRVKGIVSCAQLIYCRDLDDLVRFARPLGRYLAWRGHPLVVLDANGPVRGLVGKFFPDRMPKYFRGPDRPRLGDLAYTETAMFGV